MKHRMLCSRSLGLISTVFLASASMGSIATESTGPATVTNAAPAGEAAIVTKHAEQSVQAPTADTDAPAQLVTNAKPMPPNIRPTSPVSEIVKLANSGVDESILLAFVTNSTRTFNLGAEEIIYLNDIGVPGAVVTAMIQRDEALKTMLVAAATAPAGPEPGPPGPNGGMQPQGNSPLDQAPPPPPADESPAYAAEAPLTPPDPGAEDMFYDSLAPYGNWVDVAGYGRCWQPTAVVVNAGWQPYFDCGHWVYSDCGWYWLSDYSWGWAPFHYGTWFRHAHLGWCWVPGRVWGPSWVSWRYNDHYCGWAPLPPGISLAVGGGLRFHGRHVGDDDDCGLRPGHFRFVGWDHFNDRELRPHGVGRDDAHRIYDTTTVATRITGDSHNMINNGLPVSRVAAATHRHVNTVAIRETTDRVGVVGRAERFETSGHTMAVYRPRPESIHRDTQREVAGGSVAVGNPATGRLTPPPAAPWTPHAGSTVTATASFRNDPLILRGAQSAATRETPPPNSLVVIGRGQGKRDWTSAMSAPAATPAPSARSAELALPAREAEPRGTQPQTAQRSWMGTVTTSPQPAWFAAGQAAATERPAPTAHVPRVEAPANLPAARSAYVPQVPRYAPSPSYSPAPRSYSPPAFAAAPRSPAFESRPAPSAAPAAPAAHSSPAPQQSSGRNGR